MVILAFDQSTKVSGWCVLEDGEYVGSGVIDLHKNTDTASRSKQMGVALGEIIAKVKPDMVIIEEVQQQSNVSSVILLARIQGMLLGYAASHDIETQILEPTKWRSILGYQQGRGVKREELKQQSINYVKEHLGFDNFSEDRCEACCIALAAHKLLNNTK